VGNSGESVLDSSVFIAVLNGEPYADWVPDVLLGAVMSTVNYAEVWTKLHEFSLAGDSRVAGLFRLLDRIEPFTESQARLTGDLRLVTRPLGLSLGDRACLAVAIESGATVYTAEHQWLKLELPCEIRLIR
jgi:ribonuclease VapC